MKDLNTFEGFINEGQLNEASFEVSYTVTNRVFYSGDQLRSQAQDMGDSPEDVAEMMAADLGLVKGEIDWTGKSLTIIGSNKDGKPIVINQKGEFNMYGGPYSPKMGKPSATLDGKNVVPKIMKEFKSYGWDGDPDLGRTDIYGGVFRK